MKFQEGNRVFRWHRPDNNGLGLMTALIKTAESLPNIKILTSTTAGQLLIQDGRVCGETATNRKNEPLEIHSKSVVVATEDSTRTSTWSWSTGLSSKRLK
jgi:aspartate oxidase